MVKVLAASIFLLLSCGAAADSTTVYRVVDDDGVVGFSDTPPADPATAELIAIDTPQPVAAEESLQNLEAMRETTERMAADRREREARREAARQRVTHQPVVAGARQAQPEVRREYIYLPPQIPSRPWRPGLHPPQRPHPERPPRVQPTEGIIKGPNSQLMRPILSRYRE